MSFCSLPFSQIHVNPNASFGDKRLKDYDFDLNNELELA
jgi:hypothetical protein